MKLATLVWVWSVRIWENRGLYILVLFFLFSHYSVPCRYNGDRNLVSGLALGLRRVIQCPHATTQSEVAPPVT
uniref:Secreted protein n=1 Tax=Mesocestoides corti TaxID=53468 RepID=A0A5K3G0T8_MESCO